MRELVLHVPVEVDPSQPASRAWLSRPTRQWLLQPVPHGLRIAGLALYGRQCAACPAAAMPQDLVLMQTPQQKNIQHLELQDAQCPDLPPMLSLSQLSMSFMPDTALAVLPTPKLTMLEVLNLIGVRSCPSISCLSRLTRLSWAGRNLSGSTVSPASADILQSIKVCNACSTMLVCRDAFA